MGVAYSYDITSTTSVNMEHSCLMATHMNMNKECDFAVLVFLVRCVRMTLFLAGVVPLLTSESILYFGQ
jgi:hypothetical protein